MGGALSHSLCLPGVTDGMADPLRPQAAHARLLRGQEQECHLSTQANVNNASCSQAQVSPN